jgi:hypothetical protein
MLDSLTASAGALLPAALQPPVADPVIMLPGEPSTLRLALVGIATLAAYSLFRRKRRQGAESALVRPISGSSSAKRGKTSSRDAA